MKRSMWVVCVALAVPLCLGVFWARRGIAGATDRLPVFAGIPPVAYLVERVGGNHVTAQVLVRPGQDPHTFEPSPRQMMAVGRARLYFEVGMPFERVLVGKIRESRPDLIVVDTAKDIKKRMMVDHHHGEAEHEKHARGTEAETAEPHHHEEEEEDHEEADPHVWLSPELLKVMSRNIADALIAADPANGQDYRRNLDAFLKDIDATDARVSKVLAPYRGQSFYVFHPAFGYFGDAYGLQQEAVEVEGKSPSPRQLADLIRKAKAENVHIIFVQPQFASTSAAALAEAIGGAVVPMDSLAGDVLKNLDDMAAKIDRALGRKAEPRALRPTATREDMRE